MKRNEFIKSAILGVAAISLVDFVKAEPVTRFTKEQLEYLSKLINYPKNKITVSENKIVILENTDVQLRCVDDNIFVSNQLKIGRSPLYNRADLIPELMFIGIERTLWFDSIQSRNELFVKLSEISLQSTIYWCNMLAKRGHVNFVCNTRYDFETFPRRWAGDIQTDLPMYANQNDKFKRNSLLANYI